MWLAISAWHFESPPLILGLKNEVSVLYTQGTFVKIGPYRMADHFSMAFHEYVMRFYESPPLIQGLKN
jgi:hypothetical protein